jgi:hypothetical protein
MKDMTKVTTDKAATSDGFGVPENRSNRSGANPIIGKMVKFTNDGKFVVDKTTGISPETTLVAVGCITAWVHWVDGNAAEHRITEEGQIHPDKEDMPDRDESLWPPSPFTDGREDPWKDTRYLHLVNPQTGADFTFTTDTHGGRRAVSDLKSQIRNVRAAHPGALPIIQLRSTMMPSKRFGPKPRPEFVVVGWHGQHETAKAAPQLQAIEQQKPAAKLPKDDPITSGPQRMADADGIDTDDVPFAPRG